MEAKRAAGHATAARYDAGAERLIASIHNGVELAIPVFAWSKDLQDKHSPTGQRSRSAPQGSACTGRASMPMSTCRS